MSVQVYEHALSLGLSAKAARAIALLEDGKSKSSYSWKGMPGQPRSCVCGNPVTLVMDALWFTRYPVPETLGPCCFPKRFGLVAAA